MAKSSRNPLGPDQKKEPDLYRKEDELREVVRERPDPQDKEYRHNFSRDHGRIIHSASFRRQQGKTQVFPSRESDFFRSRLTHSLEVAQIATGIAEFLNYKYEKTLPGNGIDARLCFAAGLVHDIGHPPFGHNGERALDNAMLDFGGFEGNAQTLRILTRLEKKEKYKDARQGDGDIRAGLNLCYRTLASILKYDKKIKAVRPKGAKVSKGYYGTEKTIVANIKKHVIGDYKIKRGEDFKSLECSIMDLADDIAYSVYDLEDCLKVGFLSPAEIFVTDDGLLEKVAANVFEQTKDEISKEDVLQVFFDIFAGLFQGDLEQDHDNDDAATPREGNSATEAVEPTLEERAKREKLEAERRHFKAFTDAYKTSKLISENGYNRTAISSALVHRFIEGVELEYNEKCPPLSRVKLQAKRLREKEVLKQYTYEAAIYAPRVKLGEYRGYDVVTDLFKALMADKGDILMPEDVRKRFNEAENITGRAREVCDFVAGMTDRYAMEFWARLKSDSAESMFKPI